jgi:Xaa-Pro dipeptidase
MGLNRRKFVKISGGMGLVAIAGAAGCLKTDTSKLDYADPDKFSHIKPMLDGIVPISKEERLQRLQKAQKLMYDTGMDAIYLEGGTSMFYYLGVRWGNSERMLAAVIPKKGEISYICPAFEEEKLRELITIGDEVRVWDEHDSPYKVVAGIFKDRQINNTVGMEERVRFFLYDGIRKEAPRLNFISANPVTKGCRVYKSANEIALMQRAMDITSEAFKATLQHLREGMSQEEFKWHCTAAHKALGVKGGTGIQFGKYTALPHGSKTPQILEEGNVVLMDGGCGVEGYRSDISRTIVFGKASDRQREVWEIEREAQQKAFEAAQLGVACEEVDKAARDFLTSKGFGPGYKYLLHRTGHGIGLDVHEWENFVKGNKTPLAPGMCFSNEPMIAIKGEFGIRLEDCLYMTKVGPKFFSKTSTAIDKPFG